MQLGDEPYDDHVVHCSRQWVAAENVQSEDRTCHVHGAVDKRVSNSLREATDKAATMTKKSGETKVGRTSRFLELPPVLCASIKSERERKYLRKAP